MCDALGIDSRRLKRIEFVFDMEDDLPKVICTYRPARSSDLSDLVQTKAIQKRYGIALLDQSAVDA
jgi:hypothetical protein